MTLQQVASSPLEKVCLRDGLDIIYTSEFGQGSFDVDAAYGKIAGIILTQSLHI